MTNTIEASVENYKIVRRSDGSIAVYDSGAEVGVVKPVLRKIADIIGFDFSDEWNTRFLGKKLIDQINSSSYPIMDGFLSMKDMKKYITVWQNEMSGYVENESVLEELFVKNSATKTNTDLHTVMVKCAVLDNFYSTYITGPNFSTLAKGIISIKDIDKRIAEGDHSLVEEIANVGHSFSSPKTLYSFATKFCSHHNPKAFPIFDSIVAGLLSKVLKDDSSLAQCSRKDMRIYDRYVSSIDSVIEKYLQGATYKQFDRYFWTYGKMNKKNNEDD